MQEVLIDLLSTIKEKNLTPEQIKQLLDSEFSDYFIKNAIHDYSAYYQMDIENYYLKNSNGINIAISTGPGDIFGSNHSHRGMDISVSSICSNSSFDLCTEGEMCLISNNIEKAVSDLYTDTIKPELFLYHYDPMLLLTLTKDNRENETFMNKAMIYSYMNLKNTAKAQNSSLKQESLISPYGGLDVELKSVNEIMFESINNYKEDPTLYNNMLTLFNYDTNYITELIDDNVHALYIANHSNEYSKLFNLMDEKLYKEFALTHEEAERDMNVKLLNPFLEQKIQIELKILSLESDIKILNDKQYSFMDRLMRTKQKTFLDKNVDLTIAKFDLEATMINLDELNQQIATREQKIKSINENINSIETELQDLKDNLLYPFKNFTIDKVFYNNCDERYGPLDSLKLLVEKKEELRDKQVHLKNLLYTVKSNESTIQPCLDLFTEFNAPMVEKLKGLSKEGYKCYVPQNEDSAYAYLVTPSQNLLQVQFNMHSGYSINFEYYPSKGTGKSYSCIDGVDPLNIKLDKKTLELAEKKGIDFVGEAYAQQYQNVQQALGYCLSPSERWYVLEYGIALQQTDVPLNNQLDGQKHDEFNL